MVKLLFLGKKKDKNVNKALSYCKSNFKKIDFLLIDRYTDIDKKIYTWEGDYILSYLFPKKIPEIVLEKSKLMAINFHPGPPQYPGIGCTNYAIYNNEKFFGATCHIMDRKIDSGPIISVKKFKIEKDETLFSLTQRTYEVMYELFSEVIKKILEERIIKPSSVLKWKGKAKTRKEFLEFLEMKTNMSKKEMLKRIKSTTYPDYEPAYLKVNGLKFFAKLDD